MKDFQKNQKTGNEKEGLFIVRMRAGGLYRLQIFNSPDHPGKGDQMDRIDFTPYQEGRGFPTKKVLKGSKATIELTFEYVLEDEG